MKKTKKMLALVLLVVYTVSMMSACGSSEPEEVYLTLDNLSEYLDVELELLDYTTGGMSRWADYQVKTTGKDNITYKDVQITFDIESAGGWRSENDVTLMVAHDGNTITKEYSVYNLQKVDPDHTLTITAVRGTVLVG